MTIIQSLILGIVQGITEFLPVSSTAHLLISEKLMGIAQTDFSKTFDVAIQAGSAIAVLALYWRPLLTNKKIFLRVLAAFVPTMIIGFALHDIVKNVFFESSGIILLALALGGVALIVLEFRPLPTMHGIEALENVPLHKAMCIGLFQCLALIPGVSRSAASIVGGMLLNIRRPAATEFSFLLAVPTLLAASALDVLKNSSSITAQTMPQLGIGFVSALIVSLLVISWLLKYVREHTFVPFGVYRIAAAIGFAAMIL